MRGADPSCIYCDGCGFMLAPKEEDEDAERLTYCFCVRDEMNEIRRRNRAREQAERENRRRV